MNTIDMLKAFYAAFPEDEQIRTILEQATIEIGNLRSAVRVYEGYLDDNDICIVCGDPNMSCACNEDDDDEPEEK